MEEITVEEALTFAEENFPNAPERLIEKLGIKVKYSAINTDGWCIQGNPPIIRINNASPFVRQRFTLAHELGHLIYGVISVVDEVISPFGKKSREEKIIDKFASELLLPTSIILEKIKEIPITSKVLQNFAKKAKVSQLTVALRVASLSNKIGLSNASVARYVNDELDWQKSDTLKMTGDTPAKILAECAKSYPNPARISYEDNKVIVASFAENPTYNTKILFLQLVNEDDGFKQLREERLRELEEQIFAGELNYKRSFEGCIGWIKPRIENLSLEEAVVIFNQRYLKNSERWGRSQYIRLKSEQGSEYIRLRLEVWTKN